MIESIIRRATRPAIYNILVIGATHERYEQTLCKTGHSFYSLNSGKRWNTDYAPIPKNYQTGDTIPFHMGYDLILVHTSDERLRIAYDLKQALNIPIIRHTHTLPESEQEIIRHQMGSQVVDMDTFISKYSMEQWGYRDHPRADYINHGIDTDFWKPQDVERKPHCLSVVNFWADRDWACGWTLWNEVKKDLPVKVLGDNPGLSKPAPSLESLRDSYASSLVFLNTSLHSPVPMALIEAMACGCAVVSTENCMIPEVIHNGINGLMSNEPLVLNKFCKFLLEKRNIAKDLGEHARNQILANYSIEQFTKKWNEIINRTLYR